MKKYLVFLILLVVPIKVFAIETSATSAILMDMNSERVLYAKDIHNVRSVASISKIMTAIIAVESGKLEDKVTIGEEIDGSYGSGIYIKKGEQLTLKDLLYGLMLRSGNDASYAIAHYVGGSTSKFVDLMNQKAKELNMKNSSFHNPNGLDQDKGNYSTAYDMAILTSYAMKNKEYQKIVSTKKYSLKTNMNTYIWHNKHKLLKNYKYTTGGKTGFTEKARRTLVTTASKNNLNLVVVTLNDGNDFSDHTELFEYGFLNYKNYEILKKGNLEVPDDEYYKHYNLYIKNSFYYPLSKEEENQIVVKVELEKNRKLKNHSKVGEVHVFLGDSLIHTENIYLEKEDKKLSFLQKLKKWVGIHD